MLAAQHEINPPAPAESEPLHEEPPELGELRQDGLGNRYRTDVATVREARCVQPGRPDELFRHTDQRRAKEERGHRRTVDERLKDVLCRSRFGPAREPDTEPAPGPQRLPQPPALARARLTVRAKLGNIKAGFCECGEEREGITNRFDHLRRVAPQLVGGGEFAENLRLVLQPAGEENRAGREARYE
jgi:hypothetical protein